MKNFTFAHKYSSAVVTVTTDTYVESILKIEEIFKDTSRWRCEDFDGEEIEY